MGHVVNVNMSTVVIDKSELKLVKSRKYKQLTSGL